MSDAGIVLQRALVAALAPVGAVYDGVPPRAAFPYISIGPSIVTDWSHKTGAGREHRLQISLWDDSDGHGRLRAMMTAVEAALAAFAPTLDGHQLVRFDFVRSFAVRDAAGPDQGVIEYRALTLAE